MTAQESRKARTERARETPSRWMKSLSSLPVLSPVPGQESRNQKDSRSCVVKEALTSV